MVTVERGGSDLLVLPLGLVSDFALTGVMHWGGKINNSRAVEPDTTYDTVSKFAFCKLRLVLGISCA